jgi:hypothetical protein
VRRSAQKALRPVAEMIGQTVKARAKFSPRTSQHTLQRNRLKALRAAKAAIELALASR